MNTIVVCVNAYEHGRYEIRTVLTGEYYQVYKVKGKTGSWMNNLDTIEECLEYIAGLLKAEMEE